jgi:hypothetical protein
MQFTRHTVLAATLLTALVGCKSEEAKKEPAPAPAAAATPAPKPAPAPAPAAIAAPSKPLAVAKSARVAVTATVKSIDYATRQVTLADAAGHSSTFAVSDAVKRLDEIKAGDSVKAEYGVTLVAELRPATAEEKENPIAIVALAGRAPQSSPPAGGAVMATRVVTTVQAVDVHNMLVTLKGPMGDLTSVRGENPDNIKQIHVGDTIVITYAEAIALSIAKATTH